MKTWILAVGMGAAIASAAIAAPASKGDPARGQQLFTRCAACHKIGPNPARSIGPALNGVVGRAAGGEPGYRYSPAMKASGITWDEASIDKLLQGPSKLVPGTKMIFPGMAAPQDRADVIAYLKQYGADGSRK